MLLLLACIASVQCRRDLSSPVRDGEKSTRDWEKAAQKQEEDEAERARIREMGGSDTALVNLLEGTVETGKIHPVGDRTTGLAVQNLTKVRPHCETATS